MSHDRGYRRVNLLVLIFVGIPIASPAFGQALPRHRDVLPGRTLPSPQAPSGMLPNAAVVARPAPVVVIPDGALPNAASIVPAPPPAIPDDPPPHEGALIDWPLVIEPPDLIFVEVLEALPGRPITGEHLVRPDGTITLGFYGNVHVRGLTPTQVKEKVILRLRDFLNDESLGLVGEDQNGRTLAIPLAESDRVSVDIAAYNSKVYYVLGDFNAPGRLPFTGKETVLDAIEYAGGLAPTANPKGVKLVRPAQGGKRAKVYPIDWEAIKDRGEPEANLQLFPGDRLVVGRHPVVTATIEIDRIAAGPNNVLSSILNWSFAAKNFAQAAETLKLSPAQRDALWAELVQTWWEIANRPAGAPLDEKTFRDRLLRRLAPDSAPPDGAPK